MMDREAFIKRLQHILDQYNLTAAALADKVQVGRATVSHILLGRNKPSLEFILKLTKAFPEVDLYWLLEGAEKSKQPSDALVEQEGISSAPIVSEVISRKSSSDISEPTETIPRTPNVVLNTHSGKKVKRILLLYEDGSFESYE